MKNMMPLLIVGVLVISGFGAVAFSDVDDRSLVVNDFFSFSDPVFVEGKDFLTVDFDGSTSLLLEEGKPVIPVFSKVYTFPVGTVFSSVDVDLDFREYFLDMKIQPSPKPVPVSDFYDSSVLSSLVVPDESVYLSSDFYPSEPYSVDFGVGLDDGEHVIFVNVRCFSQYSPLDDILNVPSSIDVSFDYVLPEVPVFTADEYDMLIITDESFVSSLQPLVDHKNSIGVSTKMETVQEIYSAYSGRDASEDIKLRIKDAIEDLGVRYVLLAGGRKGQSLDWYVPSRRTHNDDGWESGYESDLYFSDVYKYEDDMIVFEDWDSNGNGVFAEDGTFLSKDFMDFYPDVTVGRIPFRYNFEVDIVVDKIIDYENNADDSWFKNALMIAGDTFPTDDQYYEGEIETGYTANKLENIGFNIQKLWTSMETLAGSDDVINGISNGVGFVHFAGHGNPASWSTHPPSDEETWINGFRLQYMSKLQNDNKLPVILVGGCHNAQFNVTMMNILEGVKKYGLGFFGHRLYYMEWVPTDLCSWFLMEEGGGSIGSLGMSGLGYGYVGNDTSQGLGGWIEPRLFYAYANQSKNILGEAHDQAITDYINIIGNVNSDQIDRKTIEEWVLLGDPSLHIGGL